MNWQEILTEDGSPTLRFSSAGRSEDMHNSAGAFTETLAVYGPTVEASFSQSCRIDGLGGPHFFSLGLGLGYNEFLIASHAASHLTQWTCVSFEADPVLVNKLIHWIENYKETFSGREQASVSNKTYARVLQLFAEKFQLEEMTILNEMRSALRDGRWILKNHFQYQDLPGEFPIHAFLWDAFSRQTNPELWDVEHMANFIRKHIQRGGRKSAPLNAHSRFATYACHRALKTAMEQAEMSWTVQNHGLKKRESLSAFAVL